MQLADIGMIGLGVMGSNLALNIAEKGYRIAVYDREPPVLEKFYASSGALQERIIPCETMEQLSRNIIRPRPVIMLIKAGAPVDAEMQKLKAFLDKGDIIIDSGNSDYRDTVRRLNALGENDPTFVGMGISGGAEGARNGPSMMVGGTVEAYRRIKPILDAIAARYKGEPCSALMGPDGAGHFVKTIHNGIEYADMQMIAEVYGILRDACGLPAAEIASVFEKWNQGPLNSYLIEITAKVLQAIDPETGRPVPDIILDAAGQKGTGRWAAIESQILGVPATGIEAAVAARSISSAIEERRQLAAIYGEPVRAGYVKADQAFIEALEQGLLAAKIAAYAQGFAVMAAASKEHQWNLPLATIARIWRAGCIIRSQFLDEIGEAFASHTAQEQAVENLLLAPAFTAQMARASQSLRHIVAEAVAAGVPVPALSSAIAYFDALRQKRGSANLIQAQRDFFGAHGFRRIDKTGDFHGPWGGL
ncbi:NADP-dependent phosphogluconate dehydrogenase [Pseudochrobactrum sp. HB0163]|uniref:NADP-dependent phosphogluconate dehydrogenase n=1 Tax=Pseudochrobactrum sp. HB0163 TaxID=3450708 RepID=UPI003F6DFAA1